MPNDLPNLPLRAEVRHNVFLAIKEAFHNVLKHSGATEVWLRLALMSTGSVLTTAAPEAHAVIQWPPSLKTALEPFGLSAPTLISGSPPGGVFVANAAG